MGRSLPPLLGLALLAGCSYDWNGPAAHPGDAGTEASGHPPDASGPEDSSFQDTGADSSSIIDSPAAEAEAGPDCASLAAQLQADLQAAQDCLTTDLNACKSVTDECGCQVPVGNMGSSAAMAFTSAVSSFSAAGCPKAALCPDACIQPAQGCLAVDGGPGGRCLQ